MTETTTEREAAAHLAGMEEAAGILKRHQMENMAEDHWHPEIADGLAKAKYDIRAAMKDHNPTNPQPKGSTR